MAKASRAVLTRIATTVTARYYPSSGATDGFYLDGRISGRREHRAADITLDREDQGFFYSVYAHFSGNGPDDAAQSRIRKALDKILSDVHHSSHNIDSEINELAECAVSVAGRITLQHDGVRQPYFAGIMVKDSELAAVTMGSGCAYLYRGDVLYPLTTDDFPIDAIDVNGKSIKGLDVYCAGVAGTVRYSNIAQLQLDDCIIVCNKEIMSALGQREVLRMLYEAEDQADAAGLIMTTTSAKLPGVPLQFMIGFVENITASDRTGRAAVVAASTGRSSEKVPLQAAAATALYQGSQPSIDDDDEFENDIEFVPPVQNSRTDAGSRRGRQEDYYEDDDEYVSGADKSSRGRRIAFYVIIAIICLGCIYAIWSMLTPPGTTPTVTTAASVSDTVSTTLPSESGTETIATTVATTEPVSTTTVSPGEMQTYTVVAGDTYYAITIKFYGAFSQEYVDLIKAANNLTTDAIQAGQILKIPAKP